MNWHYESDGKPTGPVPEYKLQQLVAEGKISALTLVWCKGMPDWQPFHQALPASRFKEQDPAAPAPAPAPSTGAIPESSGGLPHTTETGPYVTPCWDNREDSGWISAFFKTLAESLISPSFTFANLSNTGGWGRPLAFYVLASTFGFLFWILTFFLCPPENLPFPVPPLQALVIVGIPISLLFFPIQAVATTTVLHFFLWITGCANKPFETTFRIVAYAMGSTSFLLVIPLAITVLAAQANDLTLTQTAVDLASYVIIIWSVIVLVKAIANAQKVSVGRAAIAVLLPMLLVAGLVLFLALAARGIEGV